MADDRFDSSPALHLAFDGRCDTAFLACGEDLELVLEAGIVALISGICQNALENCAGELLDVGQDSLKRVAVIRLTRKRPGMNGELAALAPVHGGGDGDLDAELIGFVGFTLAPSRRCVASPAGQWMHSTSGACRE